MREPFIGPMNESISSTFIRYPIGTSLLMAGILFVGLVAYPLLPVAPLPQVDFPIRDSGSGRSGEACRQGTVPGGRAQPDRKHDDQQPER